MADDGGMGNNEQHFFSFVYLQNFIPVGFIFGLMLKASYIGKIDPGNNYIPNYLNVTISNYITLLLMACTISCWFTIIAYAYLRLVQFFLRIIINITNLAGIGPELLAVVQIIFGFCLAGHLLEIWAILKENQTCKSHDDCIKMWPDTLFNSINYICGTPEPQKEESFYVITACKTICSSFDFIPNFCTHKEPEIPESECARLFYKYGFDILFTAFSAFLVAFMEFLHRFSFNIAENDED